MSNEMLLLAQEDKILLSQEEASVLAPEENLLLAQEEQQGCAAEGQSSGEAYMRSAICGVLTSFRSSSLMRQLYRISQYRRPPTRLHACCMIKAPLMELAAGCASPRSFFHGACYRIHVYICLHIMDV